MNRRLFEILKPGGILVIADHSARTGDGSSVGPTLHRIEESVVRREVEAAGFRLIEVGNFLRSPADTRLLPKGTAFCTDAGMCGARDSIIGDVTEAVLRRFLTQLPTRLGPAEGTAQVNGLLIEAEDRDGRAISITRCDHIVEG